MGSALDTQLLLACGSGDIARVEQALNAGADIHFNNDEPLTSAAIKGHTEVVTFLLNHEPPADIHARDDYALRQAAGNGRAEVVRILLNHEPPADIHASDDGALRWAASSGRIEIVRILLNHHDPADIHANNDEALREAVKGGPHEADIKLAWYKKMAIELLRYGANPYDDLYVRKWLAEIAQEAQQAFSGGVSEDTCFTDGNLSGAVLDACATQQFGTLIGTPLLVSKNRELFKRVWDALPECWQAENRSLHMQFSKSERAMAVGK